MITGKDVPASDTSGPVKLFCCSVVSVVGRDALVGIATATYPLVICVSTSVTADPVPPLEVIDSAGVEKNPGTNGVLLASATCVTLPTTATGSVYASPGLAVFGTWATTTIAGVSVVPAGMLVSDTTTLTSFAGAFERPGAARQLPPPQPAQLPEARRSGCSVCSPGLPPVLPRLSYCVWVTQLRLRCIQHSFLLAWMTAAPECGSNPPAVHRLSVTNASHSGRATPRNV